jgi:hypothetical protein
MRAEIILTCRKELAHNLRRTTTNITLTKGADDGLTVVLDGPHRDEYRHDGQTLQPFDRPRGCGQCRDFAIKASKADFIIMVDGHMTFPVGWVDEICAHLAKHPKNITCCRMQGLGQHFEPLREGVYHGCYLQLKHPHPSMKNWFINSQWNKGAPLEKGITGGIMGACYGITREWYLKIGAPLAILEAWGGDEEILAVCSWLMGGRCYLLPPVCGHIWAAKRDRPQEDYHDKWLQWGNHYAMLEALPVPEPEKTDLRKHLDKGNNRENLVDSWLAPRRDAINHLREALKNRKHEWEWLKEKGIIK